MPSPEDDPKKWSPRKALPPFLVIAAPEESPLTPDDLIIEPAWTPEEREKASDHDDGRTVGSLVVGVYKLDPAQDYYTPDNSDGILGDVSKTGRAESENESQHL